MKSQKVISINWLSLPGRFWLSFHGDSEEKKLQNVINLFFKMAAALFLTLC